MQRRSIRNLLTKDATQQQKWEVCYEEQRADNGIFFVHDQCAIAFHSYCTRSGKNLYEPGKGPGSDS